MDTKVGKREKKGESSAWTLCSGLPSRRESNRTTNGHEWTRISSIHEAVPLILYIFRVFRAFRGSNVLFISVHSCPFVVQIFYYFRVFRAFRGLNCLFLFSVHTGTIRSALTTLTS